MRRLKAVKGVEELAGTAACQATVGAEAGMHGPPEFGSPKSRFEATVAGERR